MRRVFVVVVLLCGTVRAAVSTADTSINSTQCFVQSCGRQFTFLDGPLNVTVGGYLRSVTELSIASGTSLASGEFWMFWPVCMARVSLGGDPIVVRPDLSAILYNSGNPIRLTTLLANPDCNVRPGFAYQRWSFTGTFEQDLVFRSYPLDQHFLLFQLSDSSYNETQVRYEADDVPSSSSMERGGNVLQLNGWQIAANDTWGYVDSTYSPSPSNSSLLVRYTRANLQIVVSRGVLIYGFRILPPIVVLVLTSLMTGFMSLQDLAFRLTITVTGMLTIVFMQYRSVEHRGLR